MGGRRVATWQVVALVSVRAVQVRQDVAHPGNALINWWVGGWGGHYLPLYPHVISTLGTVLKRAGYSFPVLPSAL